MNNELCGEWRGVLLALMMGCSAALAADEDSAFAHGSAQSSAQPFAQGSAQASTEALADASGSVAADVSILVDAATPGPDVNRLVMGSNVQWVDGGDNLLKPSSIDFDPAMQGLVKDMGPTVLRYPGGNQSDLYDWVRGMGPRSARGTNVQAGSNQPQITYMGTGELLALSQSVRAEPLITVNVVSGTAGEAAAWVRQTNVTGVRNSAGQRLPKVTYWEIGNEPYLPNPNGSHGYTCEVGPVTYVTRVNAFVEAMREVDASIKIGIALASDVRNGIPFVSPNCKGYAATVLKGLTQTVDFVSIHDAYLPYDPTGKDHPANDEFLAAMASSQSIAADLDFMRELLRQYPKVKAAPFALTEYNAIFSFNPNSAFIHSMASPMAALYVADALRLFASRDDVLMANTWSLSGNDHWGAIHPPTDAGPYGRPQYSVFRLFGEALQGVRLTATVRSPGFDAPNLGFSAAGRNLPLVTTFVSKATSASGGSTLRVMAINKDYTKAHAAAVTTLHAAVSAVHLSVLTANDVLESDDVARTMVRRELALPVSAPVTVSLPPHSIALLTLQVD